MKLFGLLLLFVLSFAGLISFYNWHLIIESSELSLGFTVIQFPFGLILLGVLSTVTVLFLMNLIYMQSSSIFEMHRHAREMNASRELADKAENSRYSDLKKSFELELAKNASLNEDIKADLFERADMMEKNLQSFVEQLENVFDA